MQSSSRVDTYDIQEATHKWTDTLTQPNLCWVEAIKGEINIDSQAHWAHPQKRDILITLHPLNYPQTTAQPPSSFRHTPPAISQTLKTFIICTYQSHLIIPPPLDPLVCLLTVTPGWQQKLLPPPSSLSWDAAVCSIYVISDSCFKSSTSIVRRRAILQYALLTNPWWTSALVQKVLCYRKPPTAF